MIRSSLTVVSRTVRLSKKRVQTITEMVCSGEKVIDAEVSVILVGDQKITAMNKKFLQHNYTTDVLTFPLEVGKNIQAEIYINVQQAKRQAVEYRVSVHNEVTRLIVHGLLHALGYDDQTPKGQEKMIRTQERYVSALSALQ
jgi:rRNA maturation RNase YbeY